MIFPYTSIVVGQSLHTSYNIILRLLGATTMLNEYRIAQNIDGKIFDIFDSFKLDCQKF